MDTTFIEQFLVDLNCEQYRERFIACNLVTPHEIKYLDKDILIELGVSKIGDRIRILRRAKSIDKQKNKGIILQLDGIIEKINSLSTGGIAISEELVTDKHSVIFILNDGSAKKVNVNGCFNADSIKKRLIKRLPNELLAVKATGEETRAIEDYDVFVVDYSKNVLHLLYDVELVTICHSNDRAEKNRLIFISKDQTPSDKAISTSKKLFLKTMSVINRLASSGLDYNTNTNLSSTMISSLPLSNVFGDSTQLRIDNNKNDIRKIFNQRPPSEYISTNLAGYFPNADTHRLQKTLKESFRQSARLRTVGGKVLNPESNRIGDILLKHTNAVDIALLESLGSNIDLGSDEVQYKQHFPITSDQHKALNSASSDRIELLNTADTDDTDIFNKDAELVSLPTIVATPKAWLKGACIGSGSFGSVYLGMNAKTGELMAVKQVEIPADMITSDIQQETKTEDKDGKAKLSSNIYKKMVDALQHEMNLLKELHHENIVTYFGSSQEGQNFNIFLEYVPGGSVSSMLKNYGPFEESLITNFTRQILIGVAYLHKKNIIHRDIKGANILIDIKGGVKITDFGISKKLSPFNKTKSNKSNTNNNKRISLQGSVYWMAPEVVKQIATTEKVDIWSTGCVVVEMFTGKHPFPDFSQMQAIFKIGTNTTPEIPSWATEQSMDFLGKTFELDYEKRPSAIDLLQHPWLDVHIL